MKCNVSDIAVLNGATLKYKGVFSTIQYIDTASVDKGKFLAFQSLNVDTDNIPSRAQRAVKDGTVIISTVRPNLEHYGIFHDPDPNTIVSTGFVTVDARPNLVDSDFLYYLLTSPRTTNYLVSIASTAVSSYPSFNPEDLGSLEIEIPDSIETQKSIASILRSLDDKVKNNNTVSFTLESLAKTIYDYWFVQFDFPDENGKPYKSSGGKMVWNEELKREIPEGWEVHSASDYLSVVKGISYSSSDLLGDGIAMFNLNSFREDGSYKAEGIKTFSGRVPAGRTVLPHDLIMCVTQQTDIDLTGKRNVIGKAILVPDLEVDKATMSMDVVKLVTSDKSLAPFFRYTFALPYAHKYIVGYANGTKIKHLNVEGALSVPVIMPQRSSAIIRQFSELAYSVNKVVSNAIVENQRLSSFRDFLLPMLMNGQVTIKEN